MKNKIIIIISNEITNTSNQIKSVMFNNIEYNINSEIAENLNNYFVDSIKDIRCSIDEVQYKNQIPVINRRFKFLAISLLELRNICKTIKKKNDYRRISNNIILDNWYLVGNILLEMEIFPDNLKESLVTPIEKIKNTYKCEEFRPINSLKTFEKVLRTVVKQQLENTWRKTSYCQNISQVSEGNFHVKRLLIMS